MQMSSSEAETSIFLARNRGVKGENPEMGDAAAVARREQNYYQAGDRAGKLFAWQVIRREATRCIPAIRLPDRRQVDRRASARKSSPPDWRRRNDTETQICHVSDLLPHHHLHHHYLSCSDKLRRPGCARQRPPLRGRLHHRPKHQLPVPAGLQDGGGRLPRQDVHPERDLERQHASLHG